MKAWEGKPFQSFHEKGRMPMSMPMTAFFPVNIGIGAKKVGQLERLTDPGQMFMMTAIKKALDPLDVLNPGKVIARY